MAIQLLTSIETLTFLSDQMQIVRVSSLQNKENLDEQIHEVRKLIKVALAVLWLNKPFWTEAATWIEKLKDYKSQFGSMRDRKVLLDCIEKLKRQYPIPDKELDLISIEVTKNKFALASFRSAQKQLMPTQAELLTFDDELNDFLYDLASGSEPIQYVDYKRLQKMFDQILSVSGQRIGCLTDNELHSHRKCVKRLYVISKAMCQVKGNSAPLSWQKILKVSRTLGEALGEHRDFHLLLNRINHCDKTEGLYNRLSDLSQKEAKRIAKAFPAMQHSLVAEIKALSPALISAA